MIINYIKRTASDETNWLPCNPTGWLYLLIIVFTCSCSESSTPKPKAYARVDRIDPETHFFDSSKFSFIYSREAKIDTLVANNKQEIWFNIVYPRYNATIHCTYIPIKKNTLSGLLEDSYQLAYTHATKANSIEQSLFENDENSSFGIMYDIDGTVAVPIQFFVTDSISNFFRGSLYYNQVVDPDSVAPVTDILRTDVKQLMQSLKWKNK